jgi:AcrR family transcriptional regulator
VPEAVKSYRQVQAEETRIRIAQAARRLFAARGYGATSIESIAKEAGVATRTVYSAYGTKREILSLLCDLWLSTANAFAGAQEVLAIEDPIERLRGAAAWLANLYSSGFDIVLIFEAATDESAETKALLRSKLAGRNEVMDAMIASIEPELRIPLKQAQAVYRALSAPGVYQELVEESGWTPAEFEEFVADSLRRQLL